MYEEIQHAVDHLADPRSVDIGAFRNSGHLHAGTARRLIANPHLPTSDEENAALQAQAERWEK